MHRDTTSDKPAQIERRRLKEMARIKGLLVLHKLTLSKIDEEYGLPTGTASNAMHEPHVRGERAIAAAVKLRPEHLWLTRYHANGQRLTPQPQGNYRHQRRVVLDSQVAA